jgi:putative ABC transport system substrate-binding protein
MIHRRGGAADNQTGVPQTRNGPVLSDLRAALKNSISFVGPPVEPPADEQEYQRVFAALAQEGAKGLVVSDDPENVTHRKLIVELATKGRLPTIYNYRQFVEAGGLVSYGIDASDVGHRIADLAEKCLKGQNQASCPSSNRPISS